MGLFDDQGQFGSVASASNVAATTQALFGTNGRSSLFGSADRPLFGDYGAVPGKVGNHDAFGRASQGQAQQQQREKENVVEEHVAPSEVCQHFRLDKTAAQFGICLCGHSKAAHKENRAPLESKKGGFTKTHNAPELQAAANKSAGDNAVGQRKLFPDMSKSRPHPLSKETASEAVATRAVAVVADSVAFGRQASRNNLFGNSGSGMGASQDGEAAKRVAAEPKRSLFGDFGSATGDSQRTPGGGNAADAHRNSLFGDFGSAVGASFEKSTAANASEESQNSLFALGIGTLQAEAEARKGLAQPRSGLFDGFNPSVGTSNSAALGETVVGNAAEESPDRTSEPVACKQFKLDKSAQRFNVCICGRDRNDHQEGSAPPSRSSAEKSQTETLSAAFVPARRHSAGSSASIFCSSAGGAASRQSAVSNDGQVPTKPSVSPASDGGSRTSVSGGAPVRTSASVVVELQKLLREAGYSPAASDRGTAASRKMEGLPASIEDALQHIMSHRSLVPESTPAGNSSNNQVSSRPQQQQAGVPASCKTPSAPLFPASPPAAALVAAPQSKPMDERSSLCVLPTQSTGPCDSFQLDLSSSQFAMCRCGYGRSEHTACGGNDSARTAQRPSTIRSKSVPNVAGRGLSFGGSSHAPATSSNQRWSSGKRSTLATAPAVSPDVGASRTGQACSQFRLDMSASQFNMCQCGLDRGMHVSR